METDLTGRLKNTHLPLNQGLLPLFEAVVNSIHSIEDTPDINSGKIRIEIVRAPIQTELFQEETAKRGPLPVGDINDFIIYDNGIGFNEKNFSAFYTLDTQNKIEKGCRGIGRLMWLKCFNKVIIESVYEEDEKKYLRTFSFQAPRGVYDEELIEIDSNKPIETKITLKIFNEKYRDKCVKTLESIARNLLEHCLWYFVREGGAPQINLIDDDGTNVDINELYYANIQDQAQHDHFSYIGQQFYLLHLRLRDNLADTHSLAYCANNRLVNECNLVGKIPCLTKSKLEDEKGFFTYVCYVTSPFLDACVKAERTGFDFDRNFDDLFLNNSFPNGECITKEDIDKEIFSKVILNLDSELKSIRAKGKNRIHVYVSNTAPRYRITASKLTDEEINIDPEISESDLELYLHKKFAEQERNLIKEGHRLLEYEEKEDDKEYKKQLEIYIANAQDIKKSDLAGYVSHRKVIIDMLEKAIRKNSQGEYNNEDIIHKLIMPMQCTSEDIIADKSNLWLIDERLAFHNFLSSDKPITSLPIADSSSTKEPDICSVEIFDNPLLISEEENPPLASITVVEFKKPMRNNMGQGYEKDPIEQVLTYLDNIRKGKVKTKDGILIPDSSAIPGFCYIICDITDTMKARCKLHDLQVTHDKMGYFRYKDNYNAYVEVISLQKLVNSAKQRNRAFFDKLGFPSK